MGPHRSLTVLVALTCAVGCVASLDLGENLDGGAVVDGAGCGDLTTDPDNCGACGHVCTPHACVAGLCCLANVCQSEDGHDVCADLSTDPLHCGACGHVCESGVCAAGVCCGGLAPAACLSGATTQCVDRTSDPDHCGACGRRCDGRCIAGVCCDRVCGGVCIPGGFDRMTASVGDEARWAHMRDTDADGRDDVLVPCQLSEDIWVFRSAFGSLAHPVVVPSGRIGPGLAVGDIDRDGAVDVIAAIQAMGPPIATELRVFNGGISRTFTPGSTLLEPENPNWVALLDANRDGLLDVAVRLAARGCLAVRRQRVDGTFDDPACLVSYATAAEPEAIFASDADGDGFAEIYEMRVQPSGRSLWRHWLDASGGLARTERLSSPSGVEPWAIDLVDLDHDGRDELVVFQNAASQTAVAFATLDGAECSIDTRGITMLSGEVLSAAGDFDGDGVLDLVGYTSCTGCPSELTVRLGRL